MELAKTPPKPAFRQQQFHLQKWFCGASIIPILNLELNKRYYV